MNRPVAIKLLHPQHTEEDALPLAERFEREAKLISQLAHPNTITVFDYGQDRGELYLVMEFIDGPSLQQLIKAQGPLEPWRAARRALDILRSLEEAHHFGILHRDLKPANIMIAKDFKGQELAKVVDFGIAKLLDHDPADGELTQENAFVGTPRYSPPEQILGHELGPSADLYGVGMILWEMLVGSPAVSTNKAKECLRAHLSRQPWVMPASAQVPKHLSAIVEGALIKDPSKRYQRAQQMISDLERWLSDPEQTPQMPQPSPRESDFWDFSSNQSIDPNLGQTSELIGALIDDDEQPIHDKTTPMMSSPSAFWGAPKTSNLDASLLALADVASTQDTTVVGPTAQVSTIPEPSSEPPLKEASSPRLPTPPPPASTSRELIAFEPIDAPPQSAKPPIKLILGAAALLLLVGVGATIAISLNTSPASRAPDEHARADVASAASAQVAPAPAPAKKPTPPADEPRSSLFSEEGLEMVFKSDGWKIEQRTEPIELGNFRQRSLGLSKGKARVELTFYQLKTEQIVEQLSENVGPQDRLERFDDKLLKLHPRDKHAARQLGSTLELLAKYRELVLARSNAKP